MARDEWMERIRLLRRRCGFISRLLLRSSLPIFSAISDTSPTMRLVIVKGG